MNTRYLTNDEKIYFKQISNKGLNVNSMIKDIVGKKIKNNKENIIVSPLMLGFFNSIINGSFSPKQRVDLISIFNNKPNTFKTNNVTVSIMSMKLYYGQFKVGAEHSLNGKFGDVEMNKKYFMIQLNGKIQNGNQEKQVTFRIYKNGKIHYSGGFLNNDINTPEYVRKVIVDNYTDKSNFYYNPIVFNNTVGQYELANGIVILPQLARDFRITGKTNYEPELKASLKMTYEGFMFQIFRSGVFQIVGIKNINDMSKAYEVGKRLVDELNVMGIIKLSEKNTKNIKNKKMKKNVEVKILTKNDVNKESKCIKHPKKTLLATAKSMGILNLKDTASKKYICELIAKKLENKANKNDGVNDDFIKKIIKRRLTDDAIKENLIKIHGKATNGDVERVKAMLLTNAVKKNKSGVPFKLNANRVKRELFNNDKIKKRRLTNAAIKENLMKLHGPVTNNDVAMVKQLIYTKAKKNKNGIPFKIEADKIKRNFKKNSVSSNNNFAKELENVLNVNSNNNFAKELENVLETKNENIKQKMINRRMTENLIKEDLLKMGKSIVLMTIDQDVKYIKNMLNKNNIKKDSIGIPLKSEVERVKKNAINKWRKNRIKIEIEEL